MKKSKPRISVKHLLTVDCEHDAARKRQKQHRVKKVKYFQQGWGSVNDTRKLAMADVK